MYYLCSEKEGDDQLRLYFRVCKKQVSHDADHICLSEK